MYKALTLLATLCLSTGCATQKLATEHYNKIDWISYKHNTQVPLARCHEGSIAIANTVTTAIAWSPIFVGASIANGAVVARGAGSDTGECRELSSLLAFSGPGFNKALIEEFHSELSQMPEWSKKARIQGSDGIDVSDADFSFEVINWGLHSIAGSDHWYPYLALRATLKYLDGSKLWENEKAVALEKESALLWEYKQNPEFTERKFRKLFQEVSYQILDEL